LIVVLEYTDIFSQILRTWEGLNSTLIHLAFSATYSLNNKYASLTNLFFFLNLEGEIKDYYCY